MNVRPIWFLALILAVALTAGAGCAKKNVGSAPGADASGAQQGSGGMNESELAAKNLEQAKRVVMSEKVYFTFDSFALSPQAQDVLKRKADVLRAQPTLKVLIEGNTDERGTEEYNLALGERRAQAAKKYLVLLGVNPMQLETISYGEERPADPGHDEQAWANNRRDEFRLVW